MNCILLYGLAGYLVLYILLYLFCPPFRTLLSRTLSKFYPRPVVSPRAAHDALCERVRLLYGEMRNLAYESKAKLQWMLAHRDRYTLQEIEQQERLLAETEVALREMKLRLCRITAESEIALILNDVEAAVRAVPVDPDAERLLRENQARQRFGLPRLPQPTPTPTDRANNNRVDELLAGGYSPRVNGEGGFELVLDNSSENREPTADLDRLLEERLNLLEEEVPEIDLEISEENQD